MPYVMRVGRVQGEGRENGDPGKVLWGKQHLSQVLQSYSPSISNIGEDRLGREKSQSDCCCQSVLEARASQKPLQMHFDFGLTAEFCSVSQ